MANVKIMETTSDAMRCYPVMVQLRPHVSEDEFLTYVNEEAKMGYRLAALVEHGEIYSLAGYRIKNNLAFGSLMYVEDLVSDEKYRSQGGGKMLLQWLLKQAKENNCKKLALDSGVTRHAAHRFYINNKMDLLGYGFMMSLD